MQITAVALRRWQEPLHGVDLWPRIEPCKMVEEGKRLLAAGKPDEAVAAWEMARRLPCVRAGGGFSNGREMHAKIIDSSVPTALEMRCLWWAHSDWARAKMVRSVFLAIAHHPPARII